MASYLAKIYGTEQDKVNCSFYNKIGACRHGNECARKHIRPTYSRTILLPHLYQDPSIFQPNAEISAEEQEKSFEEFYEDIYTEAALIGQVDEMVVCENRNDHMMGNVYIMFRREEDAQKALDNFNNRWYDKRPIYCELSPVSTLRDAICSDHFDNDRGGCRRGAMCNFIHMKQPPKQLLRELEQSQRLYKR